MERRVAQAAMEYIRDDMTIGLGSGKAIEYLIEFISMANFKNLKVVANRMETAVLAQKRGLTVIPCWMVSSLDYAFDSMDYVVKDLRGLKNDDVVVLDDKIIVDMADKFIEIVNKDKFAVIDAVNVPVEVEVARPAFSYVQKQLEKMGASVAALNANNHPFRSSLGNYIIEAGFKDVKDLKALNDQIMAISGVVATSILDHPATTALVYTNDEEVETVEM